MMYHDSDNNNNLYSPFLSHQIPTGLAHDIATAIDFNELIGDTSSNLSKQSTHPVCIHPIPLWVSWAWQSCQSGSSTCLHE